MRTPFLGGAYREKSRNLSAQECVNLFLENVEINGKKEAGALYGTPGLLLKSVIGNGPIRGCYALGQFGFVVSGNVLYSLNPDFSSVSIGTLSTTTGPVRMAFSGTQLCLTDGVSIYGYDTASGFFQAVTLPFTSGSNTVIFQDGYFLADQKQSNRFWQSNLNDVFTWDGLNFSSADASPDFNVALVEYQRQVYIFGESTTEVWTNAGILGFAFQRLQGPLIHEGCIAANSAVATNTGICWLGSNEAGQGAVWFTSAYDANKISTHAMEYAIKQYPRIDDAIGYFYEDTGHYFYVLTFPSGNETWCFDFATSLWHKRAYFNNGLFSRHRSNCFMNFQGTLVVGDYENGNLYALDQETYTDNGNPLKWLRSWQAVNDSEYDRVRFNELQIYASVGVGNSRIDNPQGMLRYSKDGGHSWSQELWASLGAVGAYSTRLKWRRLSSGRDYVFEFSGTDPCKRAFISAILKAEAGTS